MKEEYPAFLKFLHVNTASFLIRSVEKVWIKLACVHLSMFSDPLFAVSPVYIWLSPTPSPIRRIIFLTFGSSYLWAVALGSDWHPRSTTANRKGISPTPALMAS